MYATSSALAARKAPGETEFDSAQTGGASSKDTFSQPTKQGCCFHVACPKWDRRLESEYSWLQLPRPVSVRTVRALADPIFNGTPRAGGKSEDGTL